MPRLQLVIPCYNEATRLQSAAFVKMLTCTSAVDLLFVDDGSTDGTRSLLENLVCQGEGRISAMTLRHNVGKAGAVRLGVLAALDKRPEFIGYWDADLATPLAAVFEFIEILDTHPSVDIVMGARVKLLGRKIQRYAVRHYFGRAFATAASAVLRLAVYDTQCGAKIFRANERIQSMFEAPFRSRWIFDVEILARYLATTDRSLAESRIYELPLKTWTDVPGSKVNAWHAARAFWELVLIRYDFHRALRVHRARK